MSCDSDGDERRRRRSSAAALSTALAPSSSSASAGRPSLQRDQRAPRGVELDRQRDQLEQDDRA